jgi:hypothetical protein
VSTNLKNQVAAIVKDELVRAARYVGDLDGVVDCEYRDDSNLVASFRVKTQQDGTHYFTVKISEQW